MSRLLMRRSLAGLLVSLFIVQAVPALAEPEIFFSPNGGIRDRLLRAINPIDDWGTRCPGA